MNTTPDFRGPRFGVVAAENGRFRAAVFGVKRDQTDGRTFFGPELSDARLTYGEAFDAAMAMSAKYGNRWDSKGEYVIVGLPIFTRHQGEAI